MPSTKAGSGEQFQKGGKDMTTAQIVEHWQAGGRVPPPSEQSPDNTAVVYHADYVAYDVYGTTIALVNREGSDDQSSGRPSLEFWWEIPIDKVAAWVNGIPQGEHFDVRAARGTLRLERRISPEPRIARQIAQFYVYRRDTGEDVAYIDVVPDDENGCSDVADTDAAPGSEEIYYVDTDVFEALQPFREGARVVFVSGPDFSEMPSTVEELMIAMGYAASSQQGSGAPDGGSPDRSQMSPEETHDA